MVSIKVLESMTLQESASHAALMCYQAEMPRVGQLIDVENRLFRVSHHTTLQHADSYKTSEVDQIAVGDVTFGLHLVSPFYNTDQRSGRFAAAMFLDPDLDAMIRYILRYWPDVSSHVEMIKNYLERGIFFFKKNKVAADEIAWKFLQEARPYLSRKSLDQIAPKVAQEQLRMFISTLFPTALDFTLNFTALVAMYEEAWTPAMRDVTEQIAQEITMLYPDMAYAFTPAKRRKSDWFIVVPHRDNVSLAFKPYLKDCVVSGQSLYTRPDPEIMHPVDRLHFSPEMMNNAIGDICVTVGMSVATMGQDQRHRTLRRGMPQFTGAFYLPPILQELDLQKEAIEIMHAWTEIAECVPGTLAMILAPYGAMVEYTKKGSFNAVLHEQHKRLCWCAQEEIYYLGVLEREEVAMQFGWRDNLLTMFQPPCFETGVCAEGVRYCGRDIAQRHNSYYFSHRKV